jgi:voltage-gated potassium channel
LDSERPSLRARVYQQLFNHGGKDGLTLFEKFLIATILLAIAVSVIGTEAAFTHYHEELFLTAEFAFGVIFLVEYVGRVWSIAERPGPGTAWGKRLRYVVSPLAIIDLVVIIATLSTFILTDAAVLRTIRLVRLAALAKFGRFSHALEELRDAVHSRRYELTVTAVLAACMVLIGATALYWAEHVAQPEAFGSIPRAMWWAIVTLTTVGYGDVAPITPLGKVLAGFIAIAGVALVALPTGIMASAFSEAMHHRRERELAARLEAHVEDKVSEEIDKLVEEEDRRRNDP